MRTVLLILALAYYLTGDVRASGAITVEIVTTETGVDYTLHKRGYACDAESKTPEEIEAWLRKFIEQNGDREQIFIYTDDRTAFKTVLEMLRRFKTAGVKQFAVCTGSGTHVQVGLSGTAGNVRSIGVASPEK